MLTKSKFSVRDAVNTFTSQFYRLHIEILSNCYVWSSWCLVQGKEVFKRGNPIPGSKGQFCKAKQNQFNLIGICFLQILPLT